MSRTRAASAAAALTAALAIGVPAVASAATITYDGSNTVVYAADPSETLDTNVGYEPSCLTGFDCVTFHGDAISAAPGQCAIESSGVESCVLDPSGSGVHVVGSPGDDTISVFPADLAGFPAGGGYDIALTGGAGNDRLVGGSAAETLDGGPGLDRLAGGGSDDVLHGGDGNDTLLGDGTYNGNETTDGGSDKLYGDAGDDTLTGDSTYMSAKVGHDVLDGGAGTDTVEDDWYRYDGDANDQDPAPTVTFDGQANDGRPGENDDVTGVEHIKSGVPAGPSAATFVGDDGANTFDLLFTNGAVRAGGGDDVITGSDYPDALDGGAGNDSISGGFGDDTITGGPGRDNIGGDRSAGCFYGPIYGACTIGSGNDTIYAQDGEADTVDCGPGADVADVDAIDTVAGCETVHAAGGSGGTGGSAGGGGGAPGGGTTTKHKPANPAKVGRPGRQRLSHLLARGLRVRVRCTRGCRLTGRLTVDRKTAKRLHLHARRRQKTVTLGTHKARLRHAGTTRLKVRPSRAVRKRIHRPRPRHLTVTLSIRVTAGGHAWTVRRHVKVRA